MESAGAVPIMRKKDFAEGAKIDNTNSMGVIKQVRINYLKFNFRV